VSDTIDIKVTYIGSLRHRLGRRSDDIVLAAPVLVRDVLEELVARHGGDLRDWFYNQYGWLDPRCMVFVGEEDARERGGLDAEIAGDGEIEIVIALPQAGG
jgi:ThiS family